MERRKDRTGRISVFKGREAKLNHAIFQILALKSPLTIYDIHKEIKAQKALKHTKYTNILRRIRALEESSYLEKAGTRKIKTQPTSRAILYQMTPRAHLAILLNKINLDNFILGADEQSIIALLVAILPAR